MSQCQKFGLEIRAFQTEGLEQATVGEEQGWWAGSANSDRWPCLFSVLSTVTGCGGIVCIHLLGWFSHLLEALGKPAVFWCLMSLSVRASHSVLRPLGTCGLAFLHKLIPAFIEPSWGCHKFSRQCVSIFPDKHHLVLQPFFQLICLSFLCLAI